MLPKIILNINKNYKRYLNNTGKRCHYSCLGWVFIAFTSWNTCSVSSDSNSESFCEEIDSVDSECWDAQFLPLLLVYINSHYCWCLFTENHTDGTKRELSVSPDELHDGQGKSGYSYCKEPSYFEIPTKELHSKPKTASQEVQEIPTKDTDHKPPATPPVVQGHASFTIEFDDQTPGKMKIKDHVAKLSIRQRNPSKESIARFTEVMSVENKVADWLVQSDATMMKRLEEQSGSDELLNKTFKGKRPPRTIFI